MKPRDAGAMTMRKKMKRRVETEDMKPFLEKFVIEVGTKNRMN
jgi:hypothetical protein